jgi:hypothetical protein
LDSQQIDEAVVALERAAALAPLDAQVASMLKRARIAKGGGADSGSEPVGDPCVLDFQLPDPAAARVAAPAKVAQPVAAKPSTKSGDLEFELPAINKAANKSGTTGVVDLTVLQIK